MALFDIKDGDVQKFLATARDNLAKRLMPQPRKGIFPFANQMVNKKQQRLFTLNASTLRRLANTDPITWSIRRTIKSHVNQAKWDIEIDTEDVESELERFEDYAIAQLSPYAIGNVVDFKSNRLDKDLFIEIRNQLRRIYEEPVSENNKKRKIQWYFQSVTRRIRQEAESHREPVKELFETPSEQGIEGTFRSLQELVLDDILIFDAGVIVKNYNRVGGIAELYHLPGEELRIYRNEDRTIPQPPEPAYVWEENGQIRAEFTKDELCYIMANPQPNGYGMSPLEVAAYVITASIFADEYNIDFFKNSNVPPGVFDLGKDITEDQRALFQQMWEQEVRGRGGLHRMLFISGSENPQFIPIRPQTNRDMQMMEYLKWTLAVKTACYGLAGQDIGFVVDYHRTTSETQAGISQARGIRTVLDLLEQFYNNEIIKKEFPFDDVKFSWQNIDATDTEKEARIDSLDLQYGIISINERRKKLGLKPVEGGDVPILYVPQVTPVSALEVQAEQIAEGEVAPQDEYVYAPEEQLPEEGSVEDTSAFPYAEQGTSVPEKRAMEKAKTGQALVVRVSRKAPFERQKKRLDEAIKTLRESGVNKTVKIMFETPETEDDDE